MNVEYLPILAGINAVLALTLAIFAGRAWARARDPRAAWMALAMTALLAMAVIIVWQTWTQPARMPWTLMAVTEGIALASLYVGALR